MGLGIEKQLATVVENPDAPEPVVPQPDAPVVDSKIAAAIQDAVEALRAAKLREAVAAGLAAVTHPTDGVDKPPIARDPGDGTGHIPGSSGGITPRLTPEIW
jgi:hypothetical protein